MISELAPSRYRGRLIVTNSALITFGQLVAYFINWALTSMDHGWRVSVGLFMESRWVDPLIVGSTPVVLSDSAGTGNEHSSSFYPDKSAH